MKTIHRKTHILKLKLVCWIRWLIVEMEPAESTEFRAVASRYAQAKGKLNNALLRERERRMNRRVS